MCAGCISLSMLSTSGKEDFLWVCGRSVTEPALLSDDQFSACSISLSLLSDPNPHRPLSLYSSDLSFSSHHCSVSVSDSELHSIHHIAYFPFTLPRRQSSMDPPNLLSLVLHWINAPIFFSVVSLLNTFSDLTHKCPWMVHMHPLWSVGLSQQSKARSGFIHLHCC